MATHELVVAHSQTNTGAKSPVLPLIAMCAGGLITALTQTLIIPIQPSLPAVLHTSMDDASWVITSPLLVAAVAMPVAGRLGDLYGKRRVLIGCAVLLLAGSLIGALAGSLIPLVAGRATQGLALGFIPVGISLIREVAPGRAATVGVASMSATLGVGGSVGLPLAALVVDAWGWRALFWLSAALAVVVTSLVVTLVPPTPKDRSGRFDAIGAAWLALGLTALLLVVSKGNRWGWTSPITLGLAVGGIVSGASWAWFELRIQEPLIDLRVAAQPPVLLTNLVAVVVGFGMMAQSVVVPMLLQIPEAIGHGLGQSVLATGLWMAPGSLTMLVFAPISSMLITRAGPKAALVIGATVLSSGYFFALFWMQAPWQLMVATVVSSAGVGIGYAAMPTLIMDATPARESGAAVGMNGLMRSIGTTSGSAVVAAVLAAATLPAVGAAFPSEGAFRLCFLVGALAALAGAGMTACIPTARPTLAKAPLIR